MQVMGTVLHERTVRNCQNKLRSFDRTKTKAFGHAPSKKTTKPPLHPPPKNGISLSSEPDSQQRLRRTILDKMLIIVNPTDRQHNTKIKSHTTSKNGQKERRQRQNSHGAKESGGRGKSLSVRPVSPRSVQEEREDSSECRTEAESCVLQSKDGEEDSASDLSDSERYSALPAQISPPDLNLRAEVIDPSDFHALRPSCRGRSKFRGSYPDFLPPPFNSWSLQQLAVYLNTEGKGIPRPKPSGQLERYLDRLLQLEWHQIQTVEEDSSKSNAPLPKGRHLTHASSHLSLSSPKCILQCQRAFPLALLSSFASAPTLHLSSCTCPRCQNQYPILNVPCRSYAYHHHHTRLSPLLEKKGQASGLPKRSSSESRAHLPDPRHRSREHRLSDPLSESSHLSRMQAIGNIRNPVGSTYSVQQVSSTATTARNANIGEVKKRRTGQRSHSCVGTREVGYRARGRSEQRKTFDETQQEIKLACVVSSDGIHSSGDSTTSRSTRRQKHVEFVTD